MNTNQKKLKLIKEGFKASTLQYLSDKQINALFTRLQEQVSSVVEPAKKGYKIGEKGGNLPAAPKGYNINKNTDGTIMAIPNEQNELGEDTAVDKDDEDKGEVSQDPVQVQGPDGMDDDSDTVIDKEEDVTTESTLKERFESKAQQNFFWAKCNTSKGVKKKKWCEMAREFSDSTSKKQYEKMPEKLHPEKTVKYKKEKTNENIEKFLENKIISILESKVKPRMKKSDLVKLVQEKSESMILRKPKKMTMFSDEAPKMKTPIAKLFSIGKTKK